MSEQGYDLAGSEEDIVCAGLIVIGDEILSGRTKDQNIGYIADHLTTIGIQLCEVRIVPDNKPQIIEAVNAQRKRYTYVFTTGGIGPTHDDITADSIAEAFAVGIDINPRALEIMRERYKDRDLTKARLRMARIPDGADLIENQISGAPGFMLENVIVMAGVPKIMQVMLDAVTPMLRKGKKMLSATIQVDKPEGDVAPVLAQAANQFSDVSMGSYPFFKAGKLGTHLVLRSIDEIRLEEATASLRAKLKQEGLL